MADGTIIALTGKAGAGKDTIADELVMCHGFKRIAFADALRKMAMDIDPLVGKTSLGIMIRYSEAIQKDGYEYVKRNYPEARRFLQRLGTEGIRGNVSDGYWVEVVRDILDNDPDTKYVITDCRFPNEAQMVLAMEGFVVEVVGSGGLSGVAGEHASEAGLPEDLVSGKLYNDGGLDAIPGKVRDLLEWIG